MSLLQRHPVTKDYKGRNVNQLVSSMNYLKRLVGVLLTGTISVVSTNGLVLAEGAEQFFTVGTDSDGVPFKLDTQTMGKKDRKFGEVLKIYQLKNDLMFEYMLHASCGDERLWTVGYRIYNSAGKKISEEKEGDKEIPAHGDSPGSTAMKYYCQAINARGW
ncbi:hypothetical protein FD723_18875 [Nostoc sp. C052]|uniref:hypothetical protein n=1 Tax=Nostoc sp. C052 TaxID=2576902 RepID=UPI0015C3F90B|nr:hypothetical protein [Nostoc sp. C052]QLE42285.1 hypothetical protein FD723_18875 [Nostoc sp. C052]